MNKRKTEVRLELDGKRVVTEAQAAELTGWHTVSIRRLVMQGKLKVAARLGKTPLIRFSDVEAYARASSVKNKLV